MDKNKSQYVILVVLVALVVSIFAIYSIINPKIAEYQDLKAQVERSEQDLNKAERESIEAEQTRKKEDEQLRNIKTIFETDKATSSDNLSMFGTMFDDVIQRIQQNGLMIRAIEYQMLPETDPLATNFANEYNVCELKFFLVGTYPQMKSLFNELNGSFPYLVGLSKVNVLLYEENTDYVLVELSLNLYSKKKANS